MAQLIKLENYVSRYELNMFRYPARFIRIKKKHLEQLAYQTKEGEIPAAVSKQSEALKRQIADEVFSFQLRWASSTLNEKSFFSYSYGQNHYLKFLLQQLPDNYLVLYRPVFLLKQAPVELDVLLVSPAAIWCITILEGSDDSVFQGSSSRFWDEIGGQRKEQTLNPIVSNTRTFRIINRLLKSIDEFLPIRRTILSRRSYIEYPDSPPDVSLVDRRNVQEWLKKMVREPSPLKYKQLKAAQYLLKQCQTVSVKRPD
jgi:hypothetical protein